MHLTAEDIARATGTPVRTAQARLAAYRDRGGPVVRLPPTGRGQPPWAISLDDYCAWRGVDRDDVLEALGESVRVAA